MHAIIPIELLHPLDELYSISYNYEVSKIPSMIGKTEAIQNFVKDAIKPKSADHVVKRTHGVFPLLLASGLETRTNPDAALQRMQSNDNGLDMQMRLRDGSIRRRTRIFKIMAECIANLKPENIIGFYTASQGDVPAGRVSPQVLTEAFLGKTIKKAQAGRFRIIVENQNCTNKIDNQIRDIVLINLTPTQITLGEDKKEGVDISISLCDQAGVFAGDIYSLEGLTFDKLADDFFSDLKRVSRDSLFRLYIGPTKNQKRMTEDLKRMKNSIADFGSMITALNDKVDSYIKDQK